MRLCCRGTKKKGSKAMTEAVEKTKAFVTEKLLGSPCFKENPAAGEYRLEHTMRVCNIGAAIAKAEGLDEEALALACLLHDVSYCEDFKLEADWLNHGRRAAAIARPFLLSVGIEESRVQEICYGIAIHVDDKADFPGERTALALSVGDADNIDRFDAYRIYETLAQKGYDKLSLREKTELVTKSIPRLIGLSQMTLGTSYATDLWRQRLTFYNTFYQKLYAQLLCSDYPR